MPDPNDLPCITLQHYGAELRGIYCYIRRAGSVGYAIIRPGNYVDTVSGSSRQVTVGSVGGDGRISCRMTSSEEDTVQFTLKSQPSTPAFVVSSSTTVNPLTASGVPEVQSAPSETLLSPSSSVVTTYSLSSTVGEKPSPAASALMVLSPVQAVTPMVRSDTAAVLPLVRSVPAGRM